VKKEEKIEHKNCYLLMWQSDEVDRLHVERNKLVGVIFLVIYRIRRVPGRPAPSILGLVIRCGEVA
jgi:hypothetical protein